MKIKISVTLVVTLALLFLAWGSECTAAMGIAPDEEGVYLISVKDIPRMSVDQLKSRLNDPSLILIDVRSPGDWNTSSIKIKGAFREVPDKENEWAPKYDKGQDHCLVLCLTERGNQCPCGTDIIWNRVQEGFCSYGWLECMEKGRISCRTDLILEDYCLTSQLSHTFKRVYLSVL